MALQDGCPSGSSNIMNSIDNQKCGLTSFKLFI
jgi:hypothetical protein